MKKWEDILKESDDEYKQYKNDNPIKRTLEDNSKLEAQRQIKINNNQKQADFYKRLTLGSLKGMFYSIIAGVCIFILIIAFSLTNSTFPEWLIYFILIGAFITGLTSAFQK